MLAGASGAEALIVSPGEHFAKAAAMGDVPLATSSALGPSRSSRMPRRM